MLGANGCGKTTLLKTMLGILRPLPGDIVIGGKQQREWLRKDLAGFISYVPQAHNDIFPFTVEEVVLMGRTARIRWYSAPGRHDREIARRCLQMLGIEHLIERNYMQLSGGERQLTLIARALAQEALILIMDEPTASLDFGNQIRVLERIKQLKTQGITIVMTTHQPDHAARVADQVVLLHNGAILGSGSVSKMLTIRHLSLLYGLDEATIAKNPALCQ